MTSTIVPPVDLAPGMPSRVVTISATDVTEGGKSLEGQMVRFALSDTLDVSSGGDVIAKTQAEVVLDSNGEGRIRLPVYDENVKTWCGQDWAILVTATWGSQKAIRVPAGTSSIALSALPPVRPLRGRELQWAVTGASVSVTEGASWDIDVSLSGGILDFDFTVPPGGTAWGRPPLGASTSLDGLERGDYIRVGSFSTAQGYPFSGSGTVNVSTAYNDANNGFQSVHAVTADGTAQFARRKVSGSWGEWAREKRPVQPLAVGDDADALRLETHDGTYRVASSAIADGVSGLPLARAGELTVRWIRGVNASTSVSVQTYITDQGEEFTRYSGTSWSPWRGGSGEAGDVSQVDVVLAIGQSNMSGRGTPSGAGLDFENPLVWQYGSKARTLRPAEVPLDMHDSATGLSPATVFAEEWVREAGPSTVCLLIPAAHGGTGFHTSPWNWGDASGAESLLEAALDQAAEGIAAASAQWPGAAVTMRAVLWHQGENTGGATEAEHTADLDTLISRIRAVYADVPFILGELSPDTTAGVAGSSSGMTHQKTPGRVERTALAHTPPNASREGDLLHLGRWGVETLGKRMFEQYPVAVANRAGEVVMPPPVVRTSPTGIEWDAPLCRATGYTVQHSPDGDSWSSAGVTVLGRRATLPAAASWARVATVGPSATSRYTHPVPVV